MTNPAAGRLPSLAGFRGLLASWSCSATWGT